MDVPVEESLGLEMVDAVHCLLIDVCFYLFAESFILVCQLSLVRLQKVAAPPHR